MKYNRDQLSFSAGTLAQAGNEDFITDFLHTFYSPHIAMLLCRTLFFYYIRRTNQRSEPWFLDNYKVRHVYNHYRDKFIIYVFNFDPTSTYWY